MDFIQLIWDYTDDGNVEHIAEHELTIDDVAFVVRHATEEFESDSSGRPCVFGYTPSGEYIIVVYDVIDPSAIYPVTAYEVPEP